MNDVAAQTVELRILTHRPTKMTHWWAAFLGATPQPLTSRTTAIRGDYLRVLIERSPIALDYHPEASGVTAISLVVRDPHEAGPTLNRLRSLGSRPHRATVEAGATALWFRDPNGTDVSLQLPVVIGHRQAASAGTWPDEVDPDEVVAALFDSRSPTH